MRAVALASIIALGACGGGGTGPDGNGGGVGFSARIDGAVWSANAAVTAVNNLPGRYFIMAAGNLNYTLTFELLNIPGPGTYPLGVYDSMHGGYGSLTQPGSSSSWTSPFNGNAGQFVITELTATRMVGTFAFVADADVGAATGTRTVTEGTFDVAVLQTGGVADPDMGSRFTATLGSTPQFYASQVTPTLFGADDLMISAQSESRTVTISLMDISLAGTNVYNTSTSLPIRTILVGTTAGGWTSATTGGSGSVNLTATADRFSGTFTATLIGPTGGGPTTPMTVSGTFSIGRAAP